MLQIFQNKKIIKQKIEKIKLKFGGPLKAISNIGDITGIDSPWTISRGGLMSNDSQVPFKVSSSMGNNCPDSNIICVPLLLKRHDIFLGCISTGSSGLVWASIAFLIS